MRDEPFSEGAFGEFDILLADCLHDLERQQMAQTLLSAAFGGQSSGDRGCFQQPVFDRPSVPCMRVGDRFGTLQIGSKQRSKQ
jgi:hypothetical protein